ncbi:MAG: lysophospholipase [Gammaproteobacteria bacterium]|nr:lysophospholipase [Gammaproteobacteria bacterium]
MKQREGRLQGANNASIYFQCWEPEHAVRAVFVLAHGAAEHSGRYDIFGNHFAARGYTVAALDHPGHGRSEGTPGHVEHFDDYIETLHNFQQQLCSDYPGVPQILLGHSMGGLIGTLYLLRHQDAFIGCVLSGPAIKTELKPGFLQMLVIRFLSAFFPKTGVLQLDASGVSRDPEEVARYINDPLNYSGKLSARLVAELFQAMENIQTRVAEIKLPLLLLHGGADVMASPEGSRFLDANVSSRDKTLNIYPGLYHEIFNEPEREQVFADILVWCEGLLGKQAH